MNKVLSKRAPADIFFGATEQYTIQYVSHDWHAGYDICIKSMRLLVIWASPKANSLWLAPTFCDKYS